MLDKTRADLLANEELEKIPSLRLKKWNATRWLGRVNCLEALCQAYPYVLNHLRDESITAKERSVSFNLSRCLANLYRPDKKQANYMQR